jgi:hypothetical protein
MIIYLVWTLSTPLFVAAKENEHRFKSLHKWESVKTWNHSLRKKYWLFDSRFLNTKTPLLVIWQFTWVQENTTYSIVNLETWQMTWINTSSCHTCQMVQGVLVGMMLKTTFITFMSVHFSLISHAYYITAGKREFLDVAAKENEHRFKSLHKWESVRNLKRAPVVQ